MVGREEHERDVMTSGYFSVVFSMFRLWRARERERELREKKCEESE